MDDLISRQQAIDDIWTVSPLVRLDRNWVDRWLRWLPPAQPYTINPDGRLWVTVDDIDKVRAVVVDEHKSKFCKQFYEDYEDAQPEIIYCGDCEYKDDGIDEDGIPFLKCLHGRSYGGTRINDFCSWAEKREVTE